MATPAIPLNDGTSIPWLAFGSGTAFYKKDANDAVAAAIRAGFRHIDTAQMYANEEHVGAGIAAACVPRAELYITTKLNTVPAGQTVRDTLVASLRKLRVDHVDLFLVHVPHAHPDLKATWREMEAVQREGLTRSIGVSNFRPADLEQIFEVATIPPAVNQIEYHPYLFKASAEVVAVHGEHRIVTTSYGGLAPITHAEGGPLEAVLDTIAQRIASVTGQSVSQGQVLQLWLREKGVPCITTTTKAERLQEYLAVCGLPDLSEEETAEIDRVGSTVHYSRFAKLIDELGAQSS